MKQKKFQQIVCNRSKNKGENLIDLRAPTNSLRIVPAKGYFAHLLAGHRLHRVPYKATSSDPLDQSQPLDPTLKFSCDPIIE